MLNNFIALLRKYQTIILITLVISLIILGIIFRLLTPFFSQETIQTPPIATTSATPSILQSSMTPPTIFPPSGDFHAANTHSGITLVFPTPVDPSTVKVSSIPFIDFKITTRRDNVNLIILSPQDPWILNENYQIVIAPGTTSNDNTQILHDQIKLNYRILEIILETYPEDREEGF